MDDLDRTVLKYALQNALGYGGEARAGSVIGKVLAEMPELRSRAKEVNELAGRIVREVNSMGLDEQKSRLAEIAPELLERERKEREMVLPELEDRSGEVIMRFAPNPSGPLHIGHSRVAVLNDEYVKRYGGRYINRFEDTDPSRVDVEAYDIIARDLEWLGVNITETHYQTDRFDIYYRIALELLEKGHGYICTCNMDSWRELKEHGKACPHREAAIEDRLHLWDKLFDGTFAPREASMVIKTDLELPNPALRDFVALRIDDQPHPRTGTKHRVYPLMNFSVAVDDHLMGLTHVLRGKDHLNNTYRQSYIFEYMGWPKPSYIHYGRVRIPGPELKTSAMSAGIKEGRYEGWNDIRLGTLSALARRGIESDALREYWVRAGISEVDVEFSWDTLFSLNREIIDPVADRYFFVSRPVPISIKGVDHLEGRAPLHPSREDAGVRQYSMDQPIKVYIPLEDIEKWSKVRLKDLCNVEIDGTVANYVGNDLGAIKKGFRIIHWVPEDSVPMQVLLPDGTVAKGFGENGIREAVGKIVQLERFGFAKIESSNSEITAVFAHK
ncbi:MAG TPA: glutamate--tRNA ligase [Euryarchaeota archaeon]|nr:glutamate--tRNA ligase [Euryarchaeota archaeon]